MLLKELNLSKIVSEEGRVDKYRFNELMMTFQTAINNNMFAGFELFYGEATLFTSTTIAHNAGFIPDVFIPVSLSLPDYMTIVLRPYPITTKDTLYIANINATPATGTVKFLYGRKI